MNATWKRECSAKRGVICGTDQSLEWILPWWWSRYSAYNTFPVTFCDFGMSQEAKAWCQERGEVVSILFDRSAVTSIENIAPDKVASWEGIYGKGIWQGRPYWFQKPFAFLESPYERSIWIDLDCEILTSIAPLFEYFEKEAELGIVRDFLFSHLPRFHPEVAYNSGIVVFEHGSKLIQTWAEEALRSNHLFWGDDPLLAHLINTLRIPVIEIPEIWNWRLSQGFNLNVNIVHWTGTGGKGYIREKGGIKPLFDQFYQSIGLA